MEAQTRAKAPGYATLKRWNDRLEVRAWAPLRRRRWVKAYRNLPIALFALLLAMGFMALAASDLIERKATYDAGVLRCVGASGDKQACLVREYVAYTQGVTGARVSFTDAEAAALGVRPGAVVASGAPAPSERWTPFGLNPKHVLITSSLVASFCVVFLLMGLYTSREDRRTRGAMERRIDDLDRMYVEGRRMSGAGAPDEDAGYRSIRRRLERASSGELDGAGRLQVARTLRVFYAVGFPVGLLLALALTAQGSADPAVPLPAKVVPVDLPVVGAVEVPQPNPVRDARALLGSELHRSPTLAGVAVKATDLLDPPPSTLAQASEVLMWGSLVLAALGELLGLLGRAARREDRGRLEDAWKQALREARAAPAPA